MAWLDRWAERSARTVARQSSRRSFLTRVGTAMVGASAIPLLPVERARADHHEKPKAPDDSIIDGDPGDPMNCDYWRYCAIDGFLCACCGGSHRTCPPGTEPSPITWIGTCRNPADGKDYIISYNDCCGKSTCGRCFCDRNDGDMPVYRPGAANDINWCAGSESDIAYHCSTAVIIGMAMDE